MWKLVAPILLDQEDDVKDVCNKMRLTRDKNDMDIDPPVKVLKLWHKISSSDPWPKDHLHLLVQITREGALCFALIIAEYTHVSYMQMQRSKVVSSNPKATVNSG